jgi:chorismate mutase
MIESNILGGNQPLKFPLQYGVSITDACIDIDSSNIVLNILNSNKVNKTMTDLNEIRDYLFLFEKVIIQLVNNGEIDSERLNSILYQNINMKDIVINYDDELFSVTKEIKLSSLLLCLLYKRLSLSELIADIKYRLNPYYFLLKDNDYYKLVTDRNVEKSILGRINSDNNLDNYHPSSPVTPINSPKAKNIDINVDLYIKLMELSKRIQVKYLEKFVMNKRIGYIGNKATISYEVINKNFNGIHVGCNTINDIYTKLNEHEI